MKNSCSVQTGVVVESTLQLFRYEVMGRAIKCPFCGNERFEGASYDTQWLKHTLACGDCGYVQFADDKPERIES